MVDGWLDGVHADTHKVTCYSCHKKDERLAPSKRCDACHVDVHKERFAKVSSSNDCNFVLRGLKWDHLFESLDEYLSFSAWSAI